MKPLKRLPAVFYRTDAGREPVREWLKGLELGDRKLIGEDIKGCRVLLGDWHAVSSVDGQGPLGSP